MIHSFKSPQSKKLTNHLPGRQVPILLDSYVSILIPGNSDGLNGDTMDGVNETWWNEGISNDHPIGKNTINLKFHRKYFFRTP